jgi:hypothetical protein
MISFLDRRPPIIYYLAPDYDTPSWGIGLLQTRVPYAKNGINASILHNKSPFRLSWIESDVPVTYLDSPSFRPRRRAILVVPETKD